MALREDSDFGPYHVIALLAKGGMASVYRAHEAGLDRFVALKVLPAEFLHDDSFSERFRREAKVIARLEHRHIVPIHAFGIDEGIPWMAMRLIAGGTVAALLRHGPVDHGRTIRILEDVAEALDYAHAKGIVHRDVKPPNILLDEADRAYLADFGVARMREGSTFLTQTGMLAGTPQYMAPELARSTDVGHHCDIYSLGVVAYEMLTGRVPFTADTPVAVLMRHVEDPVPVPIGLPQRQTEVLLRCLAKRPEDRWPSAGAFVTALKATLAERPAAAKPEVLPVAARPGGTPLPAAAGKRRSSRRLLAGGAIVAVAGIAAVLLSRGRAGAPPSKPAPSSAALGSPASPATGRINPRDGLEYVRIPPATAFTMGCVSSDKDCYPDERPAHGVSLTRGYWLGRTEVTVAAYKRFSDAAERPMPAAPAFNAGWADESHPIAYVTWADASAFCAWGGGRLPTEAEWEYAARGGGAGSRYPWGDETPVCSKGAANGAKFDDGGACKGTGTEAVASYRPNGFGLYDVSGNVWEWCADWYGAKAYVGAPATDPSGPAAGTERVLRGGALNANPKGLRLSLRNHMVPVSRSVFVGLRCASDRL